MKLLPCRSRECNALGAMLPQSTAFPRGEPMFSGQYVSDYRCARCGLPQQLTPAEFNTLRPLSRADYERLAGQYNVPALKTAPLQDLEGAGLKRAHAADMFDAGMVTAHDVHEMEMLTQRIRGHEEAGLPRGQAIDLGKAGFAPEEVREMVRETGREA